MFVIVPLAPGNKVRECKVAPRATGLRFSETFASGPSGLSHLLWRHWRWCAAESGEVFKEEDETHICGSLSLEEENKKGMAGGAGEGKE